jgi:hypothetical protein
MVPMADHDVPGERRPSIDSVDPADPANRRRLAQPPSTRYASPVAPPVPGAARSALPGPLARAALVAVAGAIAMTVVGAILTSTAGLLFVAGATGAAVGLVLARAAAPAGDASRADATPVRRRRVAWLSVALSLGAVALAGLATWLIGRAEGGVLGPIDYLVETFGPFVPGEAILAAVGAWWGASTGPVQR